MKSIDLSHLADRWPSSIVARSAFKEFSGGRYASGTMANLDSRGEGPEGFYIGRQKVYTVAAAIRWLENRCETATHERVKKE